MRKDNETNLTDYWWYVGISKFLCNKQAFDVNSTIKNTYFLLNVCHMKWKVQINQQVVQLKNKNNQNLPPIDVNERTTMFE